MGLIASSWPCLTWIHQGTRALSPFHSTSPLLAPPFHIVSIVYRELASSVENAGPDATIAKSCKRRKHPPFSRPLSRRLPFDTLIMHWILRIRDRVERIKRLVRLFVEIRWLNSKLRGMPAFLYQFTKS